MLERWYNSDLDRIVTKFTFEDIDPERVYRGDHGVDTNVKLVAVDEQGIVNELLDEGTVVFQVQLVDLLNLDAPEIMRKKTLL